MTDTSKKALICILGLAILFLTYMYVFKPAQEDVDKLNTECESLQTRLDDLIAKEAQKDQLLAETEEYKKQFDDVLKQYPADLNQETTVMFLKSIEENNEFVNQTFAMPRENEFYRLDANPNSDDGGVATQDALTGEEVKGGYVCTNAGYTISYKGAYQGIKDVLQYVADYKYRMNVQSFTITHDATKDEYSGSILINGYAISGPDRTPDSVDPGVPAGTSNLFIAGDGSSSGSSVASKYDEDQGESIKTSNNLAILLNSANSDLSAGIIAAANANRDDTYVTSSDNARVELKISVYEQDGKNYVEYSIGDQKYAAEILTSDVTVYVKSSARVDSSDVNGVDVSVVNTTTLPVYFKIVDDDTTDPRFKIVNRSGVVKTY
jgi:hypothetical protein